MRDAYYTGSDVAALLALSVGDISPNRIADFACGDGALLEAASLRWPASRLVGVDINPEIERELLVRLSSVEFVCADFLSDAMPSAGSIGLFDLVILNPPFTCRGARTESETVAGRQIRCSRALAFVVRSLRYLSEHGSLIAILPASCLSSLKDREARELLARQYDFEIVPF